MTLVNPKDFSKYESQSGPPQHLYLGFRAPIPMRINLENLAHEHRVSQATLIRHAIVEYLEKRGVDAFVAP